MPEDHLVISVGHFIECCLWVYVEWEADKERVDIIPAIESFFGSFLSAGSVHRLSLSDKSDTPVGRSFHPAMDQSWQQSKAGSNPLSNQ